MNWPALIVETIVAVVGVTGSAAIIKLQGPPPKSGKNLR